MKKNGWKIVFSLVAICASPSLLANDKECERKMETLLSRTETNVIQRLDAWQAYSDVEDIIQFIDLEMKSIESCKSSLPEVTKSKNEFFFIHSTMDSLEGTLKFMMADFEAIPQLAQYSNDQVASFRKRYLSLYRNDIKPALADDIDYILSGLRGRIGVRSEWHFLKRKSLIENHL